MTGITLLRATDRIARPWKNGGGETRDVSVLPAGAGDADFLWRTSIATIATSGPFSRFPGVDRAFLLLRGKLAIAIGDEPEQQIGPDTPTLLFGGEEPVTARPMAVTCTALNIMTRRGHVSATVGRWTTGRTTTADALLILAHAAAAVELGDERFDLAPQDAVLIEPPTRLSAIDGAVIAAEFFYVAG